MDKKLSNEPTIVKESKQQFPNTSNLTTYKRPKIS